MAAKTYRLEPQDEFTHDPGTASNYNESMYFNVFDATKKLGGFFRIGNRPNEGYAEVTICLFLPDGQVAFQFARGKIENNDAFNAGGMAFKIIEPLKVQQVTYQGKVLKLANPMDMSDPKAAFTSNPRVPAAVDLTFTGVSPIWGGEDVSEGSENNQFAKAHYEQHMAVKGTITLDGETHQIDATGVRDKSWGPRFWQAVYWYRFCTFTFGPDLGMSFTYAGSPDGKSGGHGAVFHGDRLDLITGMTFEGTWDENLCVAGFNAVLTTESGKTYEIGCKTRQTIPLRNRRTSPDGVEMETRITEAIAEYTWGERKGVGIVEGLDQIINGRPVGVAA